jgi:AraC family transcriptional regulator, transcriptional activator of pobA
MPRRAASDLPIDEFASHAPDRAIGFEAGTFEEIELPASGWAHRHTFYEIIYVAGGQGEHVIDSASYPVRPATLYFMRPGQVHFWRYEAPPSGFLIVFTEEFMRMQGSDENVHRDLRMLHSLAQTHELPLEGPHAQTMLALIRSIIDEYQVAAEGYWSVLQAYMHVLLTRAMRLAPPAAGLTHVGRAETLARQFADLVMRRRNGDQSVRAYSDALGVTPGHLAEIVMQVSGRRPSEIIREAQLLEAKRLLLHTDKTIAQVAYELGFKDSAYFGRFFKREAGSTPGDFKRLARAESDRPVDHAVHLRAVADPADR